MTALLLILLALVGHVFLAAAAFNQLHSRRMPIWLCKLLTLLELAIVVAVPPALGHWLLSAGVGFFDYRQWIGMLPWPAQFYGGVCLAASGLGSAWWAWRRWRARLPAIVRHSRARLVDLQRAAGESTSQPDEHHFLTRLPGNQSLLLDVVERGLELARLAPALDGLSVVHLSDLHLTGRVGKGYFRDVVHLSNQLAPDLVAITGDVVDRAECIDWLPEIFGNLTSRFGAYFVLGNHDRRVDVARLRRTMVEAGMVDLGGRWIEREVRGERVVLAGNELPWGDAPPGMAAAPGQCPQQHRRDASATAPRFGGPNVLRIVLAHSPDLLPWAQANDVDLLLAGHTHGGQIRFPLIGAILSASRLGVHYASGTFHAPPTIMHVSRGVSAELPLRMNCPPELIKLTLNRAGRNAAS